MHSHVTWVMALGLTISQWPAPSPDRYLNIDAPSFPPPAVTLARRPVLLLCDIVHRSSGRFFIIGIDKQHVLTTQAVFGVWGAMRELQCTERMPGHRFPSAASIPASGRRCRRGGDGRPAGPSAIVRGEKKPGRCCSRREENHASRKGHPRRLISQFIPQIFPPHGRLLPPAQCSLISICRPLRLSMQNWVKTHSASSDATAVAWFSCTNLCLLCFYLLLRSHFVRLNQSQSIHKDAKRFYAV